MEGTPSKPPRGNKSGKETGVLMRVIKTLSVSASTDHRDREKSKLEKDFRKSDLQLDSHLAEHQQALATIMTTFSHVCEEVTGAKDRVRAVKTNLTKCKRLLQCRREELQRLWLEGIEHKHALEILAKIEHIRSGSDQFTKLLNRKQYVQAVETLMGCLNTWNSDLDQIEGLKEVHNELKIKKDKMYETLREELYNEIYYKLNTGTATAFERRVGSGVFTPFQRSSSDRMSSGRNRGTQLKARKIHLDFGNQQSSASAGGYLRNTETAESDSYIIVIVDCMVLLSEVPKFVKDLRHHMEEKLLGVVNSASQQIIEYSDTAGVNETEANLFKQLVQLIFSQFRSILRSHALILKHLEKTIGKNQNLVKMHSEEYLWGKVQSVLQSTLKIYFDLSDTKGDHGSGLAGGAEFRDLSLDINSYFVKKKPQRTKKLPLFRFEYSLHGLNINDYVVKGDSTDGNLAERHRFLVCKPSPRNIITIYGIVQELCSEIEQVSSADGHKSELRKFMGNNVNKVFVQQLYKDIYEAVEAARKNPDCWRDCISLEEAKSLKCPRPLLQSVVQIGRSVQEVISLSKELPSHSEQLVKILESLLGSYIEACQNAYSGIVQPDSEDKGVISATWVKDEDIQRLLKSLPNWLKLQKAKEKKVNESMDESPEDVRNQNIRESDLLTGIFNGKTVQKHEILTDVKQLEQLAHLQESLEWFARTVTGVANSFERNQNLDAQLKEHIRRIHVMIHAFQELSDVCLLVLHLEVRVHCFHFLLPMAQHGDFSPGVDTQNADSEVIKLNKDLTYMQGILSSSLPPMKCKYVFEGVGQLISTILVGCAEHIQRINDNGVKKMCRNIFAIQKTLSDITNQPEQAMDHSRQFYELFTHSPEELVDSILEKGPQFKELEYMNALKLLFRSKPGQSKMHSLDEHLNRLSNILGDVGVVV